MRVLLTGSSGWLGRHLAPMLRLAGHGVVGLDVAPGADTDVIASVADRPALERALKDHGVEAIIHAGGLHKPDIARFPAQAFVDVNVTGTLNLLELAAALGHDRFVMTSTTSLMVSQAVRDEEGEAAVWMDEDFGPLEPRNIYGASKLSAEMICRVARKDYGLGVVVLRTGRFFPEDDDTLTFPSGDNLKANEFLNRRLSVRDAARAHLAALDAAPRIGFGVFVASAPTPFARADAEALRRDAPAVITHAYPDAADLFAARGWVLPDTITRVYDSGRMRRDLHFVYETDFAAILAALRRGEAPPIDHDPGFVSPVTRALAS